MPLNIVFMGTPDFAVPCLSRILEDGHRVSGVFTQPDKPVGRHQVLTPPPVKELALERGLSVYQPAKLRDGTALEILQGLNPDFCYQIQETGALHYGDEQMNLGLITSDGLSGQVEGNGEGYGVFMSRLYVLKRANDNEQ